MFRLKSHAAMFALLIGLLTTFNQTARAESWSWESILSFFSSENAVAICTTDPVVVNGSNSGAGSLRQAVIDACPGSTITFSASTPTVSLSTGRIVIDKNLTIQGPGANLLTVQNSSTSYDRVFQVSSGVTATLSGLTVTGGTFSIYIDNQNGAGINNQGNLTVTDATITGNKFGTISSGSSKGGGIYNAGTGTLTVTNSTISNNSAFGSGGGIFNDSGTVTITKSIITGNQAIVNSGGGGGISNYGGVVTVTDSTVSNNRSGQTGPSGGGLKNDNGGTITLTNSTVSNNKAESFGTGGGGGGGVQRADEETVTDLTISHNLSTEDKANGSGLNNNDDKIMSNSLTASCIGSNPSGYSHGGGIANACGTVNLINSTIMSNVASDAPYLGVDGGLGWNIYNGSGATVNSRNSIIAGSRPDYFGTLTSQGYNLLGMNIDTTITGDTTGNIVGTSAAPIDPRLAGLADNGGPTPTHALLAGSPAINAADTANAPPADQRGVPRVGAADIGAFESSYSNPTPTPTPTPTVTPTITPTPTPTVTPTPTPSPTPLADADADGVPDSNDNCPNAANPNQANNDGDAQGDVCDADDDGDNVPDAQDAFPLDPTESVDTATATARATTRTPMTTTTASLMLMRQRLT